MLFGISHDGNPDSEKLGEIALRYRVRRVVRAFRMHIGFDFAEKRLNVEFVKDQNVIDRRERRYERGTSALGENRAPFALQFRGALVGIDTDYKQVAFGASRLQISHMPHMKEI